LSACRRVFAHLHFSGYCHPVPNGDDHRRQADPAVAPSITKLEAYECGIKAASDSRGRYTVRFYIVAILFVIFDVETIFCSRGRSVTSRSAGSAWWKW